MKYEITEKGVYNEKGDRVPVGTVIDLKKDAVPAFLVGKVRAATLSQDNDGDGGDEKTAVTNPDKNQKKGE